MKYLIRNTEQGLTIVDRAGQPVSFDEAQQVINDLMETYAHPAYVYIACRPTLPHMEYKIGYSGQDPEKRMSQLRYQEKDDRIYLLHTIACKTVQSAMKLETEIHRWFSESRLRGEWFALNHYDVPLLMSLSSEEDAWDRMLSSFLHVVIDGGFEKFKNWFLLMDEENQQSYANWLEKTRDDLDARFPPEALTLPGF